MTRIAFEATFTRPTEPHNLIAALDCKTTFNKVYRLLSHDFYPELRKEMRSTSRLTRILGLRKDITVAHTFDVKKDLTTQDCEIYQLTFYQSKGTVQNAEEVNQIRFK